MMVMDIPRRLLAKSFEDTAFRRGVSALLPPAARSGLMKGLNSIFLGTMIRRRVDGRTILLADYPRCGNTWLRFMFASSLHAAGGHEVRRMSEDEMIAYVPTLAARADLKPFHYGAGNNLLKTHLPHHPRFRRGIVTFRNLYGSLPSLYAMDQWLARNGGGSSLTGRLLPPDAFLRYWAEEYVKFYLSWLTAADRNPGNFLFMRYEEMVGGMADLLPSVLHFAGIDPASLPAGAVAEIAGLYARSDVSWTSPEAGAFRDKIQAEIAPLLTSEMLEKANPGLARQAAEVETALMAHRLLPMVS